MADEEGVAAGMRSLMARRAAEISDGAKPIGWKMGITVQAVQEALGIAEPVVGYLTSWGEVETGATVDVSEWTAPMLEPEVAIRVAEGGGIASLAPAIELVDVDLPFERIEPILARNVFHRKVVFGPEIDGASSAGLSCRVLVDGDEVATANVTDDLSETAAFVERFLATHEAELAPGELIIAGSLTTPLPIAPNSSVQVEFGGLGSVRVGFA